MTLIRKIQIKMLQKSARALLEHYYGVVSDYGIGHSEIMIPSLKKVRRKAKAKIKLISKLAKSA